jgi:hypothetical protein
MNLRKGAPPLIFVMCQRLYCYVIVHFSYRMRRIWSFYFEKAMNHILAEMDARLKSANMYYIRLEATLAVVVFKF